MRLIFDSGNKCRQENGWRSSLNAGLRVRRRKVEVTYPDFEEFVASLNAHRVRYLIVGGYAVAFHARPRATKDIDILVDPTVANAKRAVRALEDFLGSPAPNVTIQQLTNPRTLVVLGVPPIRIDILTSIDGVTSFGGAWKRRSQGQFGRVAANYISLEDLMASKAATPPSRLQDKADLAILGRVLASVKKRR
jgi:hypothetical protein